MRQLPEPLCLGLTALTFLVPSPRTADSQGTWGKGGSFLDSKTSDAPKNTPPPTCLPYFCVKYIIILSVTRAQKLKFDCFFQIQ